MLDFFYEKLYNYSERTDFLTNKIFAPLKHGIDDKIDTRKIQSLLKTEFIGKNIIVYDKTDSTNLRAKSNCNKPDGTVFIAETQTNGRGRLGRAWNSQKGTGIWHSILLKPAVPVSNISEITLAAGLAAYRAIGHNSKIKWPNDIVIGNKKVCGILTELSADADKINYIVCGVGINVNTSGFPTEIADKATSLFAEFGHSFDRNELTANFLNEFETVYKLFLTAGIAPFKDEYKQNCVTIGRQVRVSGQSGTIIGTAEDILSDGSLLIRTENDCIAVNSGEVSIRGMYGYI